jgi:trk system potassium uptake protein
VSAILRYVRRGTVVAVASLKGTSAEGIEFDVTAKFRFPGVPLSEVRLPDGVLVGAIIRGKRVIIARGTDSIRIGDRVIVFLLPESLRRVETIFA